MAIPTTKSAFIDYCYRRLGKPVINVEVTPEQADDCVDEAISYWKDYHFDGSTKVYLKHQVTADDMTNRYIPTPTEIVGITGIFPIGSSFSSVGMFDIRYQFVLNEMANMATFSLVDYYMTLTNIRFMEELLVGKQPVRFNRHENKLYIDMNWSKIEVGTYVIIEAHAELDPTENPDVWSDRWLQNYATQKIKYQWGLNLSKFTEGVLPGGIRFNAEKFMNDAQEEIRRLEERMQWDNQLPPDDMIG